MLFHMKKRRNKIHWRQQSTRFWQDYAVYLKSVEWRKKRSQVFKRAGYICERCHQGEAVQAHHLTYAHVFNEPLEDLQAVCYRCHELTHHRRLRKFA